MTKHICRDSGIEFESKNVKHTIFENIKSLNHDSIMELIAMFEPENLAALQIFVGKVLLDKLEKLRVKE